MRISLSLLLLAASLSSVCQAKYSNEFLNLGVGSRAFGMSQAVIASADDVTAAYWNPAGLMHMRGGLQASLMHSEYFAGMAKYDYAGLAKTVADNTAVVAFSAIRFGVDDIPDTSELIDGDGNINYDRVKSFSAADYAFLFSYARQAGKFDRERGEGFSYGANVKVIHRKVGEYGKSFGFGLDAGLQYRKRHWSFGFTGRDITTTYNSWSYDPEKFESIFTATGNEVPERSTEITYPRLVLGTAYLASISGNVGLTTEINVNLTTDGKRNVLLAAEPVSADPTIGLEADYKKIVLLRAGLGNIQNVSDFEGKKRISYQPNLGIGISVRNFALDYAMTDIGNSSDAVYSNVFSVRMHFGK
jgi:hypothetical protein